MTRFATPTVYQCSKCACYLLWAGLRSFSMNIPCRWSDGATAMGGFLDNCSVACCPSCAAVLWNVDLEAVGMLRRKPHPVGWLTRTLAKWNKDKHGHLRAELEWAELPIAWKEAKRQRPLEYPDLQHALRAMTAPNEDREMFIRRRIWWATNDHLRVRSDGTIATEQPVASDAEKYENMRRMIEIHEAAGNGLPERAELLRQLGDFDDAIRLLTSGAPEIRTSANAAWILKWAKTGDSDLKKCA